MLKASIELTQLRPSDPKEMNYLDSVVEAWRGQSKGSAKTLAE
jgi:hypothetical protein